MNHPNTVKCPTCEKKVIWDQLNHWKPFCSQRCEKIDLHGWITEQQYIKNIDS
ncbi:DNA gyrase inhibitor YacG [Candidatus Erwinia haradaeae]|uniref:DNA gyrase inhibitor YacG n=1 Tax=Candidatus Erwinia haradaeae TaxID=1922217 RepID=A0A451D8D5_9GAMM|nr:DNA gyrase inhibitor YacG [Candidatus Erwinia haradaeae]VFP82109.1 DNA gyrase inhibitor YacG [Candidatus Erwinia haradaeae]